MSDENFIKRNANNNEFDISLRGVKLDYGSILITGASGYVGNYLYQELSKIHPAVLGTYHRTNKTSFSNLIPLELAERKSWELLPKSEVVIHCAAPNPPSYQNPLDYIDGNIMGSIHLMDYCARHKVKTLIFLSSIAVYGNPQSNSIDEETIPYPNCIYGASKLSGEKIVLQNLATSTIILRLPLVLSPMCSKGWLFNLFEKLYKETDATIFNAHSDFNNVVWIEDLRNMIFEILKRKNQPKSDVYALGSRAALSIFDVAMLVKKLTSSPTNIHVEDSVKKAFSIDFSKATSELNYQPKNVEDIITNYIESLLMREKK